jgi:hypothetical protein
MDVKISKIWLRKCKNFADIDQNTHSYFCSSIRQESINVSLFRSLFSPNWASTENSFQA